MVEGVIDAKMHWQIDRQIELDACRRTTAVLMGVNQSAPDQPGAELDSFSEIDENDDVSELMPRNEEAEVAILNDFVEALIDVAPPTWPPMA